MAMRQNLLFLVELLMQQLSNLRDHKHSFQERLAEVYCIQIDDTKLGGGRG